MAGVETTPERLLKIGVGASVVARPSARRRLTQKRQVGRYAPKADTRSSAEGVARPQHPARRKTAPAAVDDPLRDMTEASPKRIEVAVSSQVDLLEAERSHKLISEAAYRTGRLVQAVFERVGRVGSTNWAGTSRMDPMLVQETNLARNVDAARAIVALEKRIRDRLGMIDTRLLRRILGDRLSYAECAALQGKSGDRGKCYVAQRFREALEDLAEPFAAKGAGRPAPQDACEAAATTAPERRAAAIAGGATRRRQTRELGGREPHCERREAASEGGWARAAAGVAREAGAR